jgi:signal transduction histidine kinase
MSSESNGRKPDSQQPGHLSGTSTRLSARAPSAWGAARDALAAVHNLDALLRSTNVLYKTIRDLLPELRTSAGVLGEVFERAQESDDEVSVAVGNHGVSSVLDLSKLLDATAMAEEERDDLAKRARGLADELEAAADLLELIECAGNPVATDLSLHQIVEETGRLAGGNKGREVVARMDTSNPDANLHADPLVLGQLLTILVGHVASASGGDVVIRPRVRTGGAATISVEPATAADAALERTALRVLPTLPATLAAARRVAEQIGGTLEVDSGRVVLRLRPPAG